jgi:hypothetical protein
MKRENKFRLAIILFTIILFTGCSEDWLKEEPPHLITTTSIYSNYNGFITGLNGLTSLVREERTRLGGNDMFVNGTDNMVANLATNIAEFATLTQDWNLTTAETTVIVENFAWLYSVINAANTVLTQVETRDDVDWTIGPASAEENKNRVIAEAKAIRAWAYRHLTFLWGDVPLNLEESSGSNIKTDWVRTSVAEVRAKMKSDWLFAEQYLTVEPRIGGSITKGAVEHYLSELYLVEDNPDSALFWANKCINTPEYRLVTNRYGVKADEPGVPFMDMFYDGNTLRRQGNTESLWSWENEYGITGSGGSLVRRWHSSRYDLISIGGVQPLQITVERGGRGIARMSFTKWALDIYEPQDDRFSQTAVRKYFILSDASQNSPAPADRLPPGYHYGDTIKLDWSQDITPTYRNVFTWPFSRKFESALPNDLTASRSYDDQIYLRLADTYLLKAEAQFLLGNAEGAAQTINIIRARSHASPVTAAQINMDFILEERSRELFLEEHRRYTLLRTGTWLERVRAYNKNGGQTATERELLMPIPQSVIDANLTSPMPQNPGY